MPDRTLVTEDDVRAVLLARAELAEHRSSRLEEVHRRVGQLGRRRAATAATLAVAAITAGLVLTRPGAPSTTAPATPRPSAAPTTGPADVLPTFLRGGRLVASVDERTPTAVSLTFVPTTLLFGVVEGCTLPGTQLGSSAPAALVSINGKAFTGTACSPGGPLGISGNADMGRPGVDFTKGYGVQVGQPVLIRFGWPAGTARPGSRFRVGVYQAVPLDTFPFPPRPAVLQKPLVNGILDFPPGGRVLVGQGTAQAPNGPFTSARVRLTKTLMIDGTAVEPGEVDVLVNGRLVYLTRTWDYTQQEFSGQLPLSALGLRSGATAVITVRTKGYTGATWVVAVTQR